VKAISLLLRESDGGGGDDTSNKLVVERIYTHTTTAFSRSLYRIVERGNTFLLYILLTKPNILSCPRFFLPLVAHATKRMGI